MSTIVLHDYNGFTISQESNGYVSLTDMAKAAGKQVNDYLRLDTTKAYLEALSMDINTPVSALVKVVQGKGKKQGTWAHPEVASRFSQWCKSPQNKKTTKIGEISVRNKLATKLSGQTEVPCKTGFVDILAEQEVIEVKTIKDWKGAIGQVLVYACEFKNKTPRIHLFGNASTEYKHMILSFCSRLNVVATFED